MKRRVKRENGSGCICFRKDLKHKQWVAMAPAVYEYDPKTKTTKAKRPRIGTYATAAEAKEALREYLRMPSDKFAITFEQAYQEWSVRAFAKITDGGVRCYTAAWKKVPESMRRMRVRDIRTAQYQDIIDANAHMSNGTLNYLKILLVGICKYCMQNDVISKNYAQFVELPKKEQKEREAFSDLEVEKIKQAVGVVPYADVIYLLCYTGFRINELLSLTPFSYDRKAQVLVGGSKTAAGKGRVVPLADPFVVQIVEDWICKGGKAIICRTEGKYKGDAWKYPSFVRSCYTPALKQIGVRELTPHACRHTAITRAAKADLRPEEMMKIFGHASYDIEVQTYIHPDHDTLHRAMEKVK